MNKFLIILLGLIFPMLFYAQEGQQLFEFTDGQSDYISNRVSVNCFLEKDGQRTLLPESERLVLDLTDTKKAYLIVRFSQFILDKNAEKKLKQARLIVKNDYITKPSNIALKSFNKFSLPPGSAKSKEIKFQVVGNGNGILHIEYAVTSETYTINDIKNRDKKSIQRTIVTQNYGSTTATTPVVINEPTSANEQNPSSQSPSIVEKEVNKPKKTSSKPKKQKSAEEREWEKIAEAESSQPFEEYLKKYGDDAQFLEEANAKLEQYTPIQTEVRKFNDIYAVNISYTKNPRINEQKIDSLWLNNILIKDEKISTDNFFEVQMQIPGKYAIPIIDDWGKEAIVDLENIMEVSLEQVDENNYQLQIEGGKPPYRIDFLKEGKLYVDYSEKLNEKTFSFNTEQLANKGLAGTYDMHIRDARLTTFATPDQTVTIQPPFKIPLMVWALIGLIAIVLLYLLFMRSNRKIEEQQEDLVEATKQQMAQKRNIPMTRATTITPIKTSTRAIPASKSRSPRNSRIKIKNIGEISRNKQTDSASFLKEVNTGKYVQLDLSQLWSNSAIAEVYLNDKCIKKLHYFLDKENLSSVREEEEGAVPEIGGFLLGKYTWLEQKKQYLVSLDEFIAVSSEGLSNYQWEVSTESLVRELGSAQDSFPDLCVLGWFHTHPGHGLFLSKPDLVIHNGFFREKYQLAMEIDSMTENLDTGFFTRTHQGAINNSVRKRLNWFNWNEIEKTVGS